MWRRDSASAGDAEDETRLVSSVEEAIRLGADAAICYLFIGQHDLSRETRSMTNAALAAAEARRWGLPLVIEPMAARGGRLDPFAAATVAMNTRMAVEIGADVVKTDWPRDVAAFATVVDAAAETPILIAGGARTGDDRETLRMVDAILRAGADGILFGRALFQSPRPLALMRAVRALIHEEMTLKEALRELSRDKGKKGSAAAAA
jgi:DhnA family fructose-bisphosphate aldolase class Ia